MWLFFHSFDMLGLCFSYVPLGSAKQALFYIKKTLKGRNVILFYNEKNQVTCDTSDYLDQNNLHADVQTTKYLRMKYEIKTKLSHRKRNKPYSCSKITERFMLYFVFREVNLSFLFVKLKIIYLHVFVSTCICVRHLTALP